jgi:hypothetical protein
VVTVIQRKVEAEDLFKAWGHPNITSKHRTTIMITTDEHLSKAGDCVVAVLSEKGLDDLFPDLKEIIRNEEAEVTFIMETGGQSLIVRGRGHPGLTLTSPSDMVIRKSSFICDRTLMIKADIAALDIPPEFVRLLEDHNREVQVTIRAEL